MDTAIWVVLALGVAGWGLFELYKKGVANFWRLLAETNERHGTNFGTSPEDKATLVGSNMHEGGVLAFDRTSRRIAFLTKGGKSIEILAYDFVQSWRVTWREKTSGSGAQFGVVTVGSANTRQDNVFLEITTNDIKRPIIKMPMPSVRYAEDSAARLKIMINART